MLDCGNGASCTFDCPGGNCEYDCDIDAKCTHTCSGGGCNLLCDGLSTCALDCTGATDACAITCEKGGKATCTGNCNVPSCTS